MVFAKRDMRESAWTNLVRDVWKTVLDTLCAIPEAGVSQSVRLGSRSVHRCTSDKHTHLYKTARLCVLHFRLVSRNWST